MKYDISSSSSNVVHMILDAVYVPICYKQITMAKIDKLTKV